MNAVLSKPWYREPWPWLLMAGPAAVVVAGIATTVLAVTSYDGLVADDYYKQGLGINRRIAREEGARALGVDAAVQFDPARTRVRVLLGPASRPAAIKLSLVHPTRSGADQSLLLHPTTDGVYEATIAPPHAASVQVRIEDGAGKWRLSGTWSTRSDAVRLVP